MKAIFVSYLLAFFIGRLPGRMIDFFVKRFDINLEFGWNLASALIFDYLLILAAYVLWGFCTAWVFAQMQKSSFDRILFFGLAIAYSVIGVPTLFLGLEGYIPPQAMFVALPIQFFIGFLLVSRRYSQKEA